MNCDWTSWMAFVALPTACDMYSGFSVCSSSGSVSLLRLEVAETSQLLRRRDDFTLNNTRTLNTHTHTMSYDSSKKLTVGRQSTFSTMLIITYQNYLWHTFDFFNSLPLCHITLLVLLPQFRWMDSIVRKKWVTLLSQSNAIHKYLVVNRTRKLCATNKKMLGGHCLLCGAAVYKHSSRYQLCFGLFLELYPELYSDILTVMLRACIITNIIVHCMWFFR